MTRPLPAGRRGRPFTAAVALLAAAVVAGCAALTIDDSQLGLHKAGVREVAVPVPFDFEKGAAPIAPPAGSGMPPMIAHAIEDSLPITAGANGCRDCHDKPQAIGRPVAAGKASPAPAGHYRRDAAGALTLDNRHYVCTACHAPQADVAPIVAHRPR